MAAVGDVLPEGVDGGEVGWLGGEIVRHYYGIDVVRGVDVAGLHVCEDGACGGHVMGCAWGGGGGGELGFAAEEAVEECRVGVGVCGEIEGFH